VKFSKVINGSRRAGLSWPFVAAVNQSRDSGHSSSTSGSDQRARSHICAVSLCIPQNSRVESAVENHVGLMPSWSPVLALVSKAGEENGNGRDGRCVRFKKTLESSSCRVWLGKSRV
jgi:hypothetical protein